MTNNFETMMEKMMEQYMEKMMMKMFSNMLEDTTPQVAKAEVTTPKAPNTLSRADFLALAEEPVETTELEPIELVVYDNKGLKFNRPVSKDIWTINYITLKDKYPNVKYDKNSHGFRWNKVDSNEFRLACRDYQVITEIQADHKAILDKYYKEKARKRAEYYAGLAK